MPISDEFGHARQIMARLLAAIEISGHGGIRSLHVVVHAIAESAAPSWLPAQHGAESARQVCLHWPVLDWAE